jgi:hypothetical protein
MLLLIPIMWAIMLAVIIFPHWKIFQRAGFSGAMSLLLIIPLVNLIVMFWLAFGDWPALRGRQGGAR